MSNKSAIQRITSVRFRQFKAFTNYSVSLDRFNILVGPNNSGKSTIIGAFRILSEAMRRARAKSPVYVEGPDGHTRGHRINLDKVPVATENVFYNYEDERPATVSFHVSDGSTLTLYFPITGGCNLVWDAKGRQITTASLFRQKFTFEVGLVPILGPVEHDERLYQKDAARDALLTHRASRNFRNIWFHYPDNFDEFRELVQSTWPGMDIKPPEMITTSSKALLHMFCPEERMDREIFWAGFGFQVWCQMLTYMILNKNSSLFIIDEPDIYLHSDLQRQLVSVLRSLGPDILIATHSTEIITEADPNEIMLVNKKSQSAKRIKNPNMLRNVFNVLGSNLNPTLTQIARSKKVVYVEGHDFQIIARFAAKLGFSSVANRANFAVVPTDGFNPVKAKDFTKGMQAALEDEISVALVFDRDYRSDEESTKELEELKLFCTYAHIHNRKELENFLLVPSAISKSIKNRINEKNIRAGKKIIFDENVKNLLIQISEEMKYDVQAKYLSRQEQFEKMVNRSLDPSTINSKILKEYEENWGDFNKRLNLVPGKEMLTKLNTYLQEKYGITITPNLIIAAMDESEIPAEMKEIVSSINDFGHS